MQTGLRPWTVQRKGHLEGSLAQILEYFSNFWIHEIKIQTLNGVDLIALPSPKKFID